jgi:hypothetical protein
MSIQISDQKLNQLYWLMRLGLAFIWLWTAITSWFFYPQAESLTWLHQVGLVEHTTFWLASACLFDLFMGIASALFVSKILWKTQFIFTVFYTLAIVIYLPEFLFHPFGPITKNISIFACLSFLICMEKR